DRALGMQGACVPWQNKHDIEPLLLNANYEYIQKDEVPGLRIFRNETKDPFDIYFCKTKYGAYKILMNLDKNEVETRMAERSSKDLTFLGTMQSSGLS
ncbi:MAG: hypothetical protein KAI50_01040, partial [Desulfobacterales bacterium]|nr:hypothetical protein [Desulfobacterales bacterium]